MIAWLDHGKFLWTQHTRFDINWTHHTRWRIRLPTLETTLGDGYHCRWLLKIITDARYNRRNPALSENLYSQIGIACMDSVGCHISLPQSLALITSPSLTPITKKFLWETLPIQGSPRLLLLPKLDDVAPCYLHYPFMSTLWIRAALWIWRHSCWSTIFTCEWHVIMNRVCLIEGTENYADPGTQSLDNIAFHLLLPRTHIQKIILENLQYRTGDVSSCDLDDFDNHPQRVGIPPGTKSTCSLTLQVDEHDLLKLKWSLVCKLQDLWSRSHGEPSLSLLTAAKLGCELTAF